MTTSNANCSRSSKGLLAVFRLDHLESPLGQALRHQAPEGGLIVHEERGASKRQYIDRCRSREGRTNSEAGSCNHSTNDWLSGLRSNTDVYGTTDSFDHEGL